METPHPPGEARPLRAHALRWNDLGRLSGRLQSGHPADVADVIHRLPHLDQVKVFRLLAPAQATAVLSETHRDATRELITRLSPAEIGSLLDHLPMDDVAEVLAEDVPEHRPTLLAAMQGHYAGQVQRLLAYAPQSAERLLNERFVRVRSEMTVAETLDALQGIDPEVETLADLYVPDDAERLVGVVSLRELVPAPREHLLHDIRTTQLVSVMPDTDQEEVARLGASYTFVALPVTIAEGRLLGIVTVDDVIDVLVQEMTEDVLRFGGVESRDPDESYFSTPILHVIRRRVAWLLCLFLTGSITVNVLGRFESALSRSSPSHSSFPC